MNLTKPLSITLVALAATFSPYSIAQEEHDHGAADHHDGHDHSALDHDDVYEYNVIDGLDEESVPNIGGFLFPSMFIFGTAGAFEPGSNPEDFATTEHDPLNEAGIQAVEFDLEINIHDRITGLVAGFVYQDADHEFVGEFEESFLHYHINDTLAVGGGQFLNTFGFQNSRHTHEWEFVNQNLIQSRTLNEGHLTTQGGEILVKTPKNGGLLTLGGGGVFSHGHDEEGHGHGHGDEDDDHDEDHDDEDGEEHHDEFDIDGANLSSYVFSVDYRFELPQNPNATVSLSYARGGNESGGTNDIYGLGYQQLWNTHDHGAGEEFCQGTLMLSSEFVGRRAEVLLEDGDNASFSDYGINASAHYGLTDRATVSLRHDWVSEIDLAEVGKTHRTSPALSILLGERKRGMIRFQYDHVKNDQIGSEHVGWLQFRMQVGGPTGSHNH